jgi:hypothetical protein
MSEPMDIDDCRPISGNSNAAMYEFEDDGTGAAAAAVVDNRPLNVRIGDKVREKYIVMVLLINIFCSGDANHLVSSSWKYNVY